MHLRLPPCAGLLGLCAALVPLAPATAQPAVAERYIVQFREGTRPAEVARQVELGGGKLERTLTHVFPGAVTRMSPAAAAALARHPRVELVEQDRTASATDTQHSAPWGLDRSDQRLLPLDGAHSWVGDGTGVTAYVVDTGIRGDHADLGGRATPGFTAVADGLGSSDCNGHGTHVAGTVGGSTYGMAKGVALVPVRVLDCDGRGSYSGIIAGLDWIIAHHRAGHPAVANMSLGGPASAALDSAVQAVVTDGVPVVVAAGNENVDACAVSPARAASAMTVGATDHSDTRAWFSNYGPCLDLFAPGVGVTSAWKATSTATATISGTSMASPHVAGAVARLLQHNPSMSPAQVAGRVLGTATADVVKGPGAGSPDRLLWTEPANTPPVQEPDATTPQRVAPETAITGGPRNGAVVTRTAVTFPYSSQAATTFVCRVDGAVRSCGASELTLTGLPPGTHSFSVAARNEHGIVDPSPAVRTWTVPFDDTTASHRAGWRQVKAAGHYRETYSTASQQGAQLQFRVDGARTIALVVTRAPRHGTLKVLLGRQVLARVDLSSSAVRRRQVVQIAAFGGPSSGTLRLVTTTDRPVFVDGVAIGGR